MNFQIELHPGDEYISRYIRKNKCWEPITTEVLNEVLDSVIDPNTIFVDIGANIGYFSLVVASQGFRVVAFEPVVANYELLMKSIHKNNFQNLITTHKTFLSDKRDEITINISRANMGLCSSRVLKPFNHSYSQVSCTKLLDDYFGDSTSVPLIIKIDVEEHEKKVLYGMDKTLQTGMISHIILEIARHDPEIFEFLRRHGYVYAVSIGYDGDDKNFVTKTDYLKQAKYLDTLDHIEKTMIEDTNFVTQKMILLYKTPSPI